MGDAAEVYREGFACLPEGGLDVYLTAMGSAEGAGEKAALLIERGGRALDWLHQAAGCGECDWGAEAALGVPVDDFSGARRLAMLAVLRAERAFRCGDDSAGFDDLAAVISLARHLGRGKYVSALAGF